MENQLTPQQSDLAIQTVNSNSPLPTDQQEQQTNQDKYSALIFGCVLPPTDGSYSKGSELDDGDDYYEEEYDSLKMDDCPLIYGHKNVRIGHVKSQFRDKKDGSLNIMGVINSKSPRGMKVLSDMAEPGGESMLSIGHDAKVIANFGDKTYYIQKVPKEVSLVHKAGYNGGFTKIHFVVNPDGKIWIPGEGKNLSFILLS